MSLHLLGKLGQSKQIAHRAARAAHRGRRRIVGQSKLGDQACDSLRLLERIEILALDIFDQRQRQRGLIRNVAHQRGHFLQSRALRSAPPPFTGD